LAAAAKFLVAATKNLFVVCSFVAVTKPFFSVHRPGQTFLKAAFTFRLQRREKNKRLISFPLKRMNAEPKCLSGTKQRYQFSIGQQNMKYLNKSGFLSRLI